MPAFSAVLALCLAVAAGDTTTDGNVGLEEDVLKVIKEVMAKSDPRVRPNVYGRPVDVTVDFYVQNFGPLNEVDMEFSVEIFFRLSWWDPRLGFEGRQALMVPAKYADDLWDPDIFFPNEKTGSIHNILTKNEVFKIYPNGTVWHSIRLTLNLGCSMQLEHFPLDHQICAIKISSYSYDNTTIVLHWLPNPVEINKQELELPQFELMYWECGQCNEVYRTGTYSCKKVNFHFRRQVGFYILQTYVPCILIVTLSWVSFWINKDAVPARITLTVTTMLTMTTQLTSSRSNSMRVSYPKAMDVWYAVCMLFVFGSLLEYAFVNVIGRREKSIFREKTMKRQKPNTKDVDLAEVDAKTDDLQFGFGKNNPTKRRKLPGVLHRMTGKDLDKISRFLFPLSFLLFNIVYWSVYSQRQTSPEEMDDYCNDG